MYVGRDFDPIDEGESEIFTLDFAKDMRSGDTIVSAEWSCAVAAISDAQHVDAEACIAGSAISTGTKTATRVTGMVNGVTYVLSAEVVTTLGDTKSLWAHVRCGVPA